MRADRTVRHELAERHGCAFQAEGTPGRSANFLIMLLAHEAEETG